MRIRSLQANRLYHEYATQLYNSKVVTVWDGRFTEYGYPNPFKFRPSALSYDSFRDIMKALDFEYPRYDEDKTIQMNGIVFVCKKDMPKHSPECTVEQMNSHITFLEVLLSEIK